MNIKEKLFKRGKVQSVNRLSLEKEIYNAGAIPNLATGFVTIIYIMITTKIRIEYIAPVVISAVVIAFLLQFVVAPITNGLITQGLSDDMDSFYNYETDTKERTRLMKQLMACPAKVGIEVFIAFAIGVAIWLFICSTFYDLDEEVLVMFAISAFLGAYTGGVLAVSQTQKVCSKHACRVVEKGVLKQEVEEKHTFGIKSVKITVLHLFLPVIIVNGFSMIYAWRSFVVYQTANEFLPRLCIVSVVNLIFYIGLSSMLFLRMMKSINMMRDVMEVMSRENLNALQKSPTDLSNEFMYNMYLINSIIDVLQTILKLSSDISMEVIESSNELSVISKETAVTSLEQASGIKELLSAMEESDKLARDISEKINEVSIVAKKNTDDINDGFVILKDNMLKLSEIKDANDITVEGIKALTEKISGISDIAGIINSIADQTNIVAFNAEIEASSAGAAGQNFHLVANEIRRLTNNTIQSTNEIRKRIIEIQHSSENLLAASQNGSRKIMAGNDIINDLHDSFTILKESSESADSSSEEIKEIILQQTVAFEEIVATLRQISLSAEKFSESTQRISKSAENLCSISEELKKINMETNSEK